MVIALLACGQSTPPDEGDHMRFLRRDAVQLYGSVESRAWEPGEVVEYEGGRSMAPEQPECVTLFSHDLGDVSQEIAMGFPAPDTALAFSPDGGVWLAVGSYRGELLVLDGTTGIVRARKQLAETMVKFVAWSADAKTLYAAEQSPDAYVYALDPETLEVRWRFRVADEVESSALEADNKYGVFDLPAAFGIEPMPDGSLVLVALHGWNTPEGRRNASRVLRLDADGELVDAWPEEGAADATFRHPRVDLEGDRIAFGVHRSAAGPDPEGFPIHGVQVLTLSTLDPVVGVVGEPLLPYFPDPFVWEALDVDAASDTVLMGFGDGRLMTFSQAGEQKLLLETGTPLLAGEVPISASVGYGAILDDEVVFQTSSTLIPWGAASPELHPPSAHPRENAVWVHGLDGELRWTWSGQQVLQGFTARHGQLIVGAGPRRSDERRDLYGALAFDLDKEGSGDERLEVFCPTEGPVFFRQDVTADGRIAVAEFPYAATDGGAYRVTVLR